MELTTKRPGLGFLLAALLIAGARIVAWADEPSREYQVKAAFIANFVQFVEWPTEALGNPGDPIVITVVGENPFGTAIEQAVKNKTVKGHPINVAYTENARSVKKTHVMFVGPQVTAKPAALQAAGGGNVLTVGDSANFTVDGGVIRFFTEDNKMRFEVNTSAADRAGLKISAKLLQLAKIYKD